MAVFNEQLYQDITGNCSADIRAAAGYLDGVLTDGTSQDITLAKGLVYLANNPWELNGLTNMTNSQLDSLTLKASQMSNFEAGKYLTTIMDTELQSYGFTEEMLPYCNVLEQFDPTTIESDSLRDFITTVYADSDTSTIRGAGVAATYGSKAAFAALLYTIGRKQIDAQNAYLNSNTTVASSDNSLSWIWQTCSEYGYYQVANTSSQYNLLSRFINVAGWQNSNCRDVFGYQQMPGSPDVSLPNKYGGWHMNPSNVMFTDGLK